MFINEYFKTPIWMEEKPEFVKSLTKATDKYIKEARDLRKSRYQKEWRFWYFVSFNTINGGY
jgi:hypothetical protein